MRVDGPEVGRSGAHGQDLSPRFYSTGDDTERLCLRLHNAAGLVIPNPNCTTPIPKKPTCRGEPPFAQGYRGLAKQDLILAPVGLGKHRLPLRKPPV